MSSHYDIASVNKGLFNRDVLSRFITDKHKNNAQKIKKHFNSNTKKNPFNLSVKQLLALSEDDTIDYYISPVLELMGFTSRKKYGDRNNKFPDIWLMTEEPVKTDSEYLQAFNLTVLEAKAYAVDLDRGDGRKERPPEQILKYIKTNVEYNESKKWGILTNGYKWRLYSGEGVDKYIEFDLDHAIENIEELELFCALFDPDSFVIKSQGMNFLSVLRKESLSSWVVITDEIESRGNDILCELVNGFFFEGNNIEISKKLAYETLFKLLYILYIESKNLIPKGHAKYMPLSLRNLLVEMYEITLSEYDISKRLSKTFLIYSTGKGILPKGFGGEHFKSCKNIKIKNIFLKNALEYLTIFEKEKSIKKFFDYSSLNVELIGNIYESTMALKFNINKGEVNTSLIKKKTGTEVHSSGTTYTPPNVVKYLLTEVFPSKFTGLPLVCDPACGSGHFLVQALKMLADRIPYEVTGAATLQEHKRIIASESIYGTDINDLASKLARLMLVLETSDKGKSALDFTKNIKSFNALLVKWRGSSNWINKFDSLRKKGAKGFDYIVGNPPYVRADEPGELVKREEIKNTKQYIYLEKRWDLFIPFIELAKGLVKPNDGAVSFVVSDGITYSDYAKTLTEKFSNEGIVKIVSHFDKAFPKWAFPATCFILDYKHSGLALRRKHVGDDPFRIQKQGASNNAFLTFEKENILLLKTGWSGLKIGDSFYVSKGLVLHMHEKYNQYRKSNNVKVAKKERLKEDILFKDSSGRKVKFKDFDKDDLVSIQDTASRSHPMRYYENQDLKINRIVSKSNKYLEYGPGLRSPQFISRPTFAELHVGKRVIVSGSKEGRAAVLLSQECIVPQNTMICKSWNDLKGVVNKSISKKILNVGSDFDEGIENIDLKRKILESISKFSTPELLTGILNSKMFIEWMVNDKKDKHRIVPDLISELPLPVFFGEKKKCPSNIKFDVTFQSKIDEAILLPIGLRQSALKTYIEKVVQELSKASHKKTEVLINFLDELVSLYYEPVFNSELNKKLEQENTKNLTKIINNVIENFETAA